MSSSEFSPSIQEQDVWEELLVSEGLGEIKINPTTSEAGRFSTVVNGGDALEVGDLRAAAERARFAAIEEDGDLSYGSPS